MWLTKKLAPQAGLRLSSGLVDSGEGFSVQGERAYRAPQQVAPYGLSSRAAGGSQAVLLDGFCAGVLAGQDSAIKAGEVRLFSSGGAEILLKNDGSVVINGQAFPAESP